MPISTEAPRCSDFARTIDLLPAGTGLFLARVVLVSVPLPWPKPALKHPSLVAAAAHLVASPIQSRLFAAEPVDNTTMVEVFERIDGKAHLYRWVLSDPTLIEPLIEAVASAELGTLDQLQISGAAQTSTSDLPPMFLVCTQGSHDSCCGTTGVMLADTIEQERPGYVVRRVSHTGGHRFSPTLLAFPDGRMWAFVDLALVDRIAEGTATAQDYQNSARGWWGAPVGPAQVAEIAVRAEYADGPFVAPTIQALDVDQIRSAKEFAVKVNGSTWRVDVHVGRQVPSIACEMPGGLPAKPGREFAWTIERQ